MTVLGVDTSSVASSCALVRDGVLLGEFFANIGLTHSQTNLPLVRSLLEHTRTALGAIDVFAVTAGPGSFTGLRIGIACVKGMAVATDRPCAALSTLHVLAMGAESFEGFVAPVMDARRAQVYTALFEGGGEGLRRVGGDETISIQVLGERLARCAPKPVLLVGDGAALCFEALALPHLRLAPERFRHQRAGCVAALGEKLAHRGALVGADALAPTYLRLPQAERERLGRRPDKDEPTIPGKGKII